MQTLQQFFINFGSSFGVWDAIDIAIISFVLYKLFGFIRETRAAQLFRGILVLVVALALSNIFHLNALHWILNGVMQFGVIALIVVFQPELRRALEFVGRSKFLRQRFTDANKEKVKYMSAVIAKAVDHFSTDKIGALIIMEREISLNDFAETGIVLDAQLTPELLANIFYLGAPLHDGAVIIKNANLYAASCKLPLTRDKSLSIDLGTRHRAGIGITEVSDALAIIVSEETGIISTAIDGRMTRYREIKALEKTILNLFLNEQQKSKRTIFLDFFRRKRDVS